MNVSLLDRIERGPRDARSAVIWLHGLGADGHDFEPIVDELGLAEVRFVFPHAPVMPVTINGGLPMRAWFDIVGLDFDSPQDADGIRRSAAAVSALIDAEIGRGVASERIVLAGFSQGGAIALHAALREPRALGGVIALSTFLPLADTLAAEKCEANAHIPILMAHGDADPVIPIRMAERSRERLEREGYDVEWHRYPIAHTVSFDEVRDIGRWLAARV
ncbi:MAG TPA: alpha/beta fold hydrolase [Gammaproteobacteria bacterium]